MKELDNSTPTVHSDGMITKQITSYYCHRCGEWFTPKNQPRRCGKCKSPYWKTKRNAPNAEK
tara:strand:+ start:224 stop:409 length:186 start_codon:yes stop_codon:yes gene_type:complete